MRRGIWNPCFQMDLYKRKAIKAGQFLHIVLEVYCCLQNSFMGAFAYVKSYYDFPCHTSIIKLTYKHINKKNLDFLFLKIPND
jgi:hypothetical protein